MAECNFLGVEKQAGRLATLPWLVAVAIQRVAEYWIVEAKPMGAMHTQLVCPASLRPQQHAAFAHHFIISNRLTSMLKVNHLPGAVVEVGTEGQGNGLSIEY